MTPEAMRKIIIKKKFRDMFNYQVIKFIEVPIYNHEGHVVRRKR